MERGMFLWEQVPTVAGGVQFPGAAIIGSCEPPDTSAGDWTQALCRSTHTLPAETALQSPA